MSTRCSYCGKQINEDSEQNKGKRYLYCPCNHALIPKGSNSYITVKGGLIKMAKKEKEQKEKKQVVARAGKVLVSCSICNKQKNRTQKFVDRLAAKNVKFICAKCKKKNN